jgi:hypothetical protein
MPKVFKEQDLREVWSHVLADTYDEEELAVEFNCSIRTVRSMFATAKRKFNNGKNLNRGIQRPGIQRVKGNYSNSTPYGIAFND